MRMGSCLICCKEAEFLTYPDGERKYAGRDDVDCTECGGYSITDEHKPELERVLGGRQDVRRRLSKEVKTRYCSGSTRIVVEINSASLAEMLRG